MNRAFATQVYWLARRSVVRTFRQPASAIPAVAFPLILLSVNTGGLHAATRLPGFPTNSFLDFALAFAFMQGAMFSTMNAGTDLAKDIQTGFLTRLSLTPLKSSALLAGQLAGVLALGLVQAIVYLTAGLAAGATIEAGIGGIAVLLLLSMCICIAFGTLGAFLALRTGSGEAVQGLFPLLFVLLFLSSMNMPRNLISIGWFRTIATINPVSYLIEGRRSLVIVGWDGQALALAFGIVAAIGLIALVSASRALKVRLARA